MGTSRLDQPLRRYKRITVIFSDPAQTRTLTPTTNPALSAFDIIAVVPQDEKTFNMACTALDIATVEGSLTRQRAASEVTLIDRHWCGNTSEGGRSHSKDWKCEAEHIGE